ncbi:DUF664 domain-containing protein [Nocardioides anomalus]|uniref:DUF664 domain-containing protein n=1 Tax=Nocardioides anomalus TaxID=2712223 RepID=A0A6G6WEG4_9ACTN|nr:DinB family protein [Nocardioides anomalus]QIG43430.1 DUF664 domain-containing protein [Nocardioides anomalus]
MAALPFPSPTTPQGDRREVLLGYLAYFRSALLDKLDGLPEADLRRSLLPSGWTPLELLHHLTHVERRWLVWGFSGDEVPEPWGDTVDDRWHVPASLSLGDLTGALAAQAVVSERVVRAHALDAVGAPSERWEGAPPATLERVLLHLVQEYARHVGHLDVVRELLDGHVGE